MESVVQDAWDYMSSAAPDTFAALAGSKIIEQLVEAQTTQLVKG